MSTNKWTNEMRSRLAGSRSLMKNRKPTERPGLKVVRAELAQLLNWWMKQAPSYKAHPPTKVVTRIRAALSRHDRTVKYLTGVERIAHPPLNP